MDVNEREKPLVKDLNEHIICPLCRGYFVDATTLVECLHSFCRGCIVRRLSNGVRACPVCNVPTLPPLFSDIRLQRLVYLIVPGLFRSESEKRRHFRIVNPQCTPLLPPLGSPELTYDDPVSLSISEIGKVTSIDDSIKLKRGKEKSNSNSNSSNNTRLFKNKTFYEITGKTRYLKCPAGVTVRHLQRLLMLKRGWDDVDGTSPTCHRIEIMYEVDESETESRLQILETSWTLLDLACIFEWKNESPMKLYYCFVSKEESDQVQIATSCGEEASNKESTEVIENIQRPPTPPPSPKPISHTDASLPLEKGRSHTSTNVECVKEPEVKKPRCEVTPVMRAPDPPGNNINNNNNNHLPTDNAPKPDKVAKLEHHKRRKRRNKRVIAEITTTPREDLLKLKVRLTPCPPRITSSTNNQTKEKLLQMRAVRREKIKTTSNKQRNNSTRDDNTIPENTTTTTTTKDTQKTEESIEEIIDGIPDEIVKIAQNINSQTKTTTTTVAAHPEVIAIEKNETNNEQSTIDEDKPKDEEVLRRLGLVAINETNKTHRDKMKISQNNEKEESLNREKLEQQLRESKANRVRSLLAEKQMRDALKSMMSNSKDKTGGNTNNTVGNNIKRKGPPPLAPLRSTKRTNNNIAYSSSNSFTQKCEIPLDLSSSSGSGGSGSSAANNSIKIGNNILDLSPNPGGSSKGKNNKINSNESRISAIGISAKSKDEHHHQQQQRKSQDLNLRTLSDAAVSLLSDCGGGGGATTASTKSTTSETIITGSMNVGSKVALRIPQPHQRISGFGMKIRPNLGIRHIPNPQAVVASQYRNQRAGFFNVSNRPS
ncbi:probable serine/threonine-protein kinase nek3 [Leptopilina heterotoma]|uniref:probable serine/threonine-protein kinase nek3 n=1 Tax=Leptopilina heterotoma TaxID=63436 RepID=UPI001CA9F49A|nr:probable serine/threonine-protein kinase nek3 [Leptopilina heterotoma]XP_043481390.1 probable serine/threonine-protein kinase nek3 [Leptopilina heterotoma]